MSILHSIRSQFGGELSGRTLLTAAPGHSRKDRGASITLSPGSPDGIIVHLFNGNGRQDDIAAKDYYLAAIGQRSAFAERCTAREPVDLAARRREAAQRRAEARRTEKAEDDVRSKNALRLWEEARQPAQTPVAAYLAGRGVDLVGDALRYHPICPFAGQRTPTMVALATDIRTGKPRAIHRTALTRDGRKAEVGGHSRMSLGPLRGAAIRLLTDPESDVLGVGEGVESTLSLHRVPEFGRRPVWSLLSASGLTALPAIKGVATLWIAVDHDPAGIAAARDCAQRWRRAGRTVRLVVPDRPGTDLNDQIRARGAAA